MSDLSVTLTFAGLSPRRRDLDSVEKQLPTVADIGGLIASFDGERFDQVLIEATREGDDVQIGIVGGSEGLAVLHIFDSEDTYYQRVRGEEGESLDLRYVLVSSGGSEVDVLARWRVTTDMAIRGLWYFLLTGQSRPRALLGTTIGR